MKGGGAPWERARTLALDGRLLRMTLPPCRSPWMKLSLYPTPQGSAIQTNIMALAAGFHLV